MKSSVMLMKYVYTLYPDRGYCTLKVTSLYVLPPVILATAILPNKCDQKNSKDIKRAILTKRTQISTDTENCPAIPADKAPTCGEQHQKLHEHNLEFIACEHVANI